MHFELKKAYVVLLKLKLWVPPPRNPYNLQANGYDWMARVLHSSAFIIIFKLLMLA